jgi:hypothetical protein
VACKRYSVEQIVAKLREAAGSFSSPALGVRGVVALRRPRRRASLSSRFRHVAHPQALTQASRAAEGRS